MLRAEKQAAFVGRALDEIKDFPEQARRDAGYQIHRIQGGHDPDDWKPMNVVGKGAREIRIWADDGTYRVIYVANVEDAVYILHAFEKKDQKTRQSNIDTARNRYKALMQELSNG